MNNIILNKQQEIIKNEAVEWFNHSSSQLFEISGGAGVGKSVLIKAILDEIGLNNREYLAMSYTGQAAIVMRTKGFSNAKSIHSSLYEVIEVPDTSDVTDDLLSNNLALKFGVKRMRKSFRLKPFIDPAVRLFFIDEAYMVPKNMVKDILSFGIKVIAAGDSHQLPPVSDEPGFLTGYGIHYLTEIMRQNKNSPILYLAERAINNEPIHCGSYGNDVLVVNDTDFIPQMIGYCDCVLCGTNKTRELMNNYVRSLAGFNGFMPRAGERVICRKNNWEIQIDGVALANGLAGIVCNNPDPSAFDGKTFLIDFKPDLSDNIFYNIPLSYKYFTGTIDEKNAMKKSFEAKWLVGELFDYAYALTVHLAQGAEYNVPLYIEEWMRPNIQSQLNYTAITRSKKKLIYVKKTNKYFRLPQINSK